MPVTALTALRPFCPIQTIFTVCSWLCFILDYVIAAADWRDMERRMGTMRPHPAALLLLHVAAPALNCWQQAGHENHLLVSLLSFPSSKG